MDKLNYRAITLTFFMLVIISVRIVAPLSPDFKVFANFSGIGAVALFGGTYFRNKGLSFVMPIAVLFLSDLGLVLSMGKDYGFYDGWYYTYIAFTLMILVGRLVIRRVNLQNVTAASLIGVFLHWIISDYGVWLGSTLYPQNLGGFWACLVAAIPYELNFLYGTLGYSAIMFGAYQGLTQRFPELGKSLVSGR